MICGVNFELQRNFFNFRPMVVLIQELNGPGRNQGIFLEEGRGFKFFKQTTAIE
jgi:hypothetical protein